MTIKYVNCKEIIGISNYYNWEVEVAITNLILIKSMYIAK